MANQEDARRIAMALPGVIASKERFAFSVESIRQIKHSSARLKRTLPMPAGESGIGSEEGKIDVAKMFRIGRLDERGLVADLIKLSEGLVIVEQLYIGEGEIRLVEHLLQLAAFECGCADDGSCRMLFLWTIR